MSSDDRIRDLIADAVTSNADPSWSAPAPLTADSLRKAIETVETATYEPRTSLHNPKCPGILSGDMTQCGWFWTGCFW